MSDRPNILIFMVDQLNGTLFPDGPAEWLHAPNLKALAARSTRFANAYTGSPLCAPGRASFMSGQEFPVPTIVGINGVGGQQTSFRGAGTSLIVSHILRRWATASTWPIAGWQRMTTICQSKRARHGR